MKNFRLEPVLRNDCRENLMIDEVRDLQTLEQVMSWAFARKPPGELVAVVTQDEFTHDVVIKTAADVWLVFDTN